MRNFKYILLFIFSTAMLSSCLEDEAPEDAYGVGPNLVSFEQSSSGIQGVSDGSQYVKQFPMLVKGPSMPGVDGTITATISADPSSTAKAGLHYELSSNTVTFSPENNYLALIEVTMLTEGIVAPLEEAPVLKLIVEDVSGEDNVIANGKPLPITLNYLCFSNLAGNYNVSLEHYRDGAYVDHVEYADVLTETASGEYRGTMVAHWGDLGVGNPGFTFLDVCNQITIPEQNLVDYYSNLVEGVAGKSVVDPETGNIYMEYKVCASGSCHEIYADYIKQ